LDEAASDQGVARVFNPVPNLVYVDQVNPVPNDVHISLPISPCVD